MIKLARLFTLLLLTSLATIGCGSLTGPVAGTTTNDEGNTQQADDNGESLPGDDALPDEANGEADDSLLSADHQAAVDAAVDASGAIGQAVAAILPVTELQAVIEGGRTPPACPAVDMELGATTIDLELDYGAGCAPVLYPTITFSGSVEGTAFVAFNAFEFSCVGLQAAGASLDGTIAGSFILSGGVTVLSVTVGVTLKDGASVTVSATVELEGSTGVMTITDGTAQVTPATGGLFSAEFTSLVVDAVTTGNFIPEAGTATLSLVNDPARADGVTIAFEFTKQTPIDGTVSETTVP